jgi:3-oxoacyl-[acyl-carrier-protein] synthase II
MQVSKKRRVVVSGLGMVTPLGNSVQTTWSALLSGYSGVTRIEDFDPQDYPSKICAPIKNFNPSHCISSKEQRKLDLFIQYALCAAEEAIQDAAIDVTALDLHRVGVLVGSGIGGLRNIEANCLTLDSSGPRRVSPFFIPSAIINLASGNISIKYGFKGPNLAISTACASASHSIALASRMIAWGDADMMICGGAEKASTALGMAGFAAVKALSKRNDDPQRASRPWDKDRDGFVLGDGAGILVLEEYEHAKSRGAPIYAELAGVSYTGDAHHITAPDPEAHGSSLCMQQCLDDAGLSKNDIQYINAHATSTPAGDLVEVKAVKSVFGKHAEQLCISSTKSMHGHLLGATGAVEAAICVLAIRDQIAPPTINLDNPDVGCDLDFVVSGARKMRIDACLTNSLGFGGTNGCLIFQKNS